MITKYVSSRTLLHCSAAFLVILIILAATAQYSYPIWSPQPDENSGGKQAKRPSAGLSAIFEGRGHDYLSAEQYLKYVATPLVQVSDDGYTSFGGLNWEVPHQNNSEHTVTEPMGQGLCIIDLDNRGFNESGQIWAETPMSWDRPQQVHGLSLGVLNHWLYAKIHGYKYYFIDIDEYQDRRASWKKAIVIPKILAKHKTCIYLDSDAIFQHIDLPFEWLMDYWQLSSDTNSLALAYDPDLEYNKDEFDQIYLNTGFIVAQNNEKTFEIMDAWSACPEEGGDHPNCTDFRLAAPGRPTDQGGFGTFIRYDYPDDIKGLPCNEANGFPESGTECKGAFIRHLWTGKDNYIKIAVGRQTPGDLLEMFHAAFLKEKDEFWQTEQALFAAEK